MPYWRFSLQSPTGLGASPIRLMGWVTDSGPLFSGT